MFESREIKEEISKYWWENAVKIGRLTNKIACFYLMKLLQKMYFDGVKT